MAQQVGVAFLRRAVTAGAGEANAYDVVAVELAALFGAERCRFAAANKNRLPRPPRLTAEQAIGGKAMAVTEQRDGGAGAEDLNILANTAAAPMSSRTAGIGDELEAMEQDGVVGFVHLDRQVGRVEDRAQRLRAILVEPAAIPAEDEIVHHPWPAGVVMHPAEDGIGPVRERTHHALRQRLGKRAVDGVEDADLNVRPAAAGGRIFRIEKALAPRHGPDRPLDPIIVRHVHFGKGADAESRVGARVVYVGVDAGLDLIAAAREIDNGLIPLDVDIHADTHRLGAGADIVEHVIEAVDAIGNGRDQLARALLRSRQELLDGTVHSRASLRAVEGAQALGADMIGIALRAQVAAHLLRNPDIAKDDAQQVLIELAFADEPHGQNAEALLKSLGDPLHGLRTWRGTSDVDVVRRVDDVSEQPPLLENRHHHVEIGIVAPSEIGIVGDDGVSRVELIERNVGKDVLDHVGHGAEMARRVVALGDQSRRRVEYAGGEILALANSLGERGAPQRSAHLLGDRDQRIPDERERDRVDLAVRITGHAGSPDRSRSRDVQVHLRPRHHRKERRSCIRAPRPDTDPRRHPPASCRSG